MIASFAIMAHPSRTRWVDYLQRRLGLDVPVAWATPPWATPKDQSPIWRTKREALLMHTDAPYHCVLQDDAILCPDFRERIAAMEPGDRIVNLFYRHKRAYREVSRLAQTVGASQGYFTTRGYLPLGVGIVLPTDRIPDVIEFSDALLTRGGDDPRIKRWMADRGVELFVPIPSLIDHRIGPSLIGHPPYRSAWRFAS